MTDRLKSHVLHIAHTLENPEDVTDDGVTVSDAGLTWVEDAGVYRDEAGEEVTDVRPMTGMDYLSDALDIEYVVSSDGTYLGARVLVSFGGPNIWVDTRNNRVEGHCWGESFSCAFQDNVGLDEALEELWACR